MSTSAKLLFPLILLIISLTANSAYAADGPPPEISGLTTLISKIIGLIAPVAAIGFFLMLVYSGYLYIFSFGDQGKAGKARGVMLTALIGIAVLILVYLIFVAIGLATGCNVLELNFDNPGGICPHNTGG